MRALSAGGEDGAGEGKAATGRLRAALMVGLLFVLPRLLAGAVWLGTIIMQPLALRHDVVAFWMAGRHLAQGGSLAQVYDFSRFLPMERAAFPGLVAILRCPYPPPAMLLFLPLGWFRFAPAAVGWVIAGLAALFAAGWVASGRGKRWWALLLPLAPVSFVDAMFEQTGAFVAAFATIGLLLARRRPVAGGVVLGLLCVKPQYALLPGVALLAARNGKAVAAALASVAAASLAATALWGWGAWLAWFAQMPDMVRFTLSPAGPVALGATPAFALHVLGLPQALMAATQALSTVAAVALVALAAWRRGLDRATVGLVLAAMPIATPYALVYDLTLAAGAVLLLLAEAGPAGLGRGEAAVLAAAWNGPLLPLFTMIVGWTTNYNALAVAILTLLLVAVLARRVLAAPAPGAAAGSAAPLSPRCC